MKISTLKNIQSIFFEIGRRKQIAKTSILLVGMMILVMSSFGQQQTIHVTPPVGGIEIDGDLEGGTISSDPGGDWVKGTGTSTNTFIFNDNGTLASWLNPKKSFRIPDPYGGPGSGDKSFANGSKFLDNPGTWTWNNSGTNDKTDVNNVMFHLGTKKNGAITEQWLFVAGDKKSTNGSMAMDFEFLQKELIAVGSGSTGSFTTSGTDGGRTKNDVVITVEFQNGGSNAVFHFYLWEWNGTKWTYTEKFPNSSIYVGRQSSSTISVPFGAFGSTEYTGNQFVEAAVNMTRLFAELTPCEGFKVKTVMIKTRLSATTDQLGDFVEPNLDVDLDLGTSISYLTAPFCNDEIGQVELAGLTTTGTYNATGGLYVHPTEGWIDASTVNPAIGGSTYTITYAYLPTGSTCTITQYAKTQVTIYPKPIGTASSKSICSGDDTNIIPTVSESSKFIWTMGANTNGVTNATSNSTPTTTINQTLTATNPSIAGLVEYIVTPISDANGCYGIPFTITVTVNIKPIVSNMVAIPTCSGSQFSVIPQNVTNGTVPVGTTYSWSAPTVTGSMSGGASGSGATITGTLFNLTTSVQTATYTVTPMSGGCSGSNFIVTVPVYPTSTVNPISDAVYCNGASGSAISFSSPVSGTTYSWSSTEDVGFGTSGNTSIPSFTATNGGTTAVVATVTITPSANGCTGPARSFKVTVNPNVVFGTLTSSDETICYNGDPANITFSTAPTGGAGTFSYQWYYQDGLASSCPSGSSTTGWTQIVGATGSSYDPPTGLLGSRTYAVFVDATGTPDCGVGTWASGCRKVTVNPLPFFTVCSLNINQETDLGNCTAVVYYTATAVGTPTPTITFSFTGATVASGTGTGSGSTFNKGVTTVVITASNICANVTCSFTVTVNDDQKPVLARCAATLNIEGCSTSVITSPSYSAVSAPSTEAEFENATNNGAVSDNCGITSVSYIDVASGTCPIVVTRTWLITDAAGNSVTCTQTINVKDTTAPTWTTAASNLNRTLSCEDSAGLTNAQSLVPVANDACDASLTPVKTSGVFVPAGCGNAGIYTNTFKVTDDCGNTSGTFTQVITITDTKSPTWTTTANALDRTLSCEDLSGLSTAQALVPVATDNCDANLTPVKTAGAFAPSGCGNAGIYTNTFKVTDDCGNESSIFTQVITITDTKAPTWTSAADALNVTLSCEDEAGLASAQAMVPVATDNCDVTLTPVKTSGLFVSAGCGYSGSYTNTFKVTDDCGNVSGTYTQVITITDTKAPVIVGTLGSTTVFGCSIADAPPAATTAQGLLDLGLTSISDNCTPFNSLTVSYSDTNSGKCPIYIYRTYMVTDLCGNSTTITSTYIIKIEDKIAPAITNVPLATTYSCGSDVPAGQISSVTVNDDCLGFVTVLVSDVTTSGSCVNKYSINRIWTATDVCGNVSTATQVITVDDQTNPVIQTFPADVTVSCSGDVPAANTSSVTATDNCSGTVSITVDADVISNQSCENQYTIKRTYWATDICGNKTSKIQTITVNDNVAPNISSIPANVTVSCVAEIPVANTSSVTASDNCSGTLSVTVSADVVSNKTCDNRYTISRTYFATDVCGNTSSKTQTILVDDEIAPVISSIPADVTVSCASEVPLANTALVTASDNCNGTVSITVSADVVSNQACANRYTITRTYTATDVCGNKSTSNQIITVFDNTSPVISGVPSSQTYHCASEVPVGQIGSVTVADNCSGLINVTVTDVTTQGNCANRYTITRTWTATDLCGNATSASQSITVYDDIAPQISGVPQSQTYSCAADVPLAQANSVVATDNCSGAVSVTVADTREDGLCANRYTLTRVWVATDVCGNTSSATQVITVNDQTPPAISGTISETTVSGCYLTDLPAAATTVQGLATLGLTVTDGCSGTASLTVTSQETVTGSCPIVVSRVYSISDACGNTSTYTQTINVMDTTAPVITGTASVVTVEGCSAQAAPAKITTPAGLAALGLTVTDNCTGSASLTVTSNDVATGSCPIIVTRVYRIADVCGNASTFTQTINITDTTAPVIVGTLNTLNIEGCSATSAPAAANTVGALEAMGVSISDNCSADGEMTVTSSDVSQGGCSAIVTRTYRITDKCGNPITAVQTIRVNDVTPPSVSGTLNTFAVEGCSAADAVAAVTTVSGLEAMGVSITDGCTTDVNLLVTSTQTSTGTCPIVVTRVYQVTDACGNSVNLTQAIRVGDTTAPTARGKNIILPLTPQGTASITASDIDGGSVDNCGIKTRIASKTLFTCSQLGAQTVTLTVIDNCGNTSTATAVVTVIDPNPASISINDVVVSESSGTATLTVSLSTPRACDVSFTVNTLDNTALVPSDYLTVSATVYTIPGGSSSLTVVVPIVNDKVAEPTESFFVNISNPVNVIVTDNQGVVSITDDDSPPTVLIGDASANEGDKLNFSVTLSNITSEDITVTLGFTHISTTNGDFDVTPVTVMFPAGTISATAIVQSTDDYIQESNETFIVKVVGTTGPVGNTGDTGTGTIIDNDKKPIAVDDHLAIDEDNSLHGNVDINDHPNMEPGDVWSLLSPPANGTVILNPDGSFIYTPDADYNGNDSFTYKLCDSDGDCDDATVYINTNPVDDLPIANDDTFTAHMDGSIDGDVAENDVPSGDGGNVWTIVTQPANGTVMFNPDGTFVYTPAIGYLGSDTFSYKLCDGDSDCDEAVVSIVVEDIIPNQIFTPNGDGQNDKYQVKNIEYYPGSKITIFNRWGNKVYQNSGYLNDWDGYSNTNKVGSDPLPIGTYYYVIEYGVNRHKTGFVYLER